MPSINQKQKPRASMSVKEAAAIIGVTEETIRRLLKDRRLEGYRVTMVGKYRVYVDSVEKLLRDREITSDRK